MFHIYKCLKICQLNIIKKTKKDYKINAREECQNLSKKEKEKKQQYGDECYKNLSEDETIEKKNYRMRKMPYYNYKKLLLKKKT